MGQYESSPDIVSWLQKLQGRVASLERQTQQNLPPTVVLAQSSAQSVGGAVDVAFDDVVLDSDLTVTSSTLLTVRTAGQWLFVAGAQWAVSPGAGDAHSIWFQEPGGLGPFLGAESSVFHPQNEHQCVCTLRLEVGAQVKLVAAKSALVGPTQVTATLTAQWLAP